MQSLYGIIQSLHKKYGDLVMHPQKCEQNGNFYTLCHLVMPRDFMLIAQIYISSDHIPVLISQDIGQIKLRSVQDYLHYLERPNIKIVDDEGNYYNKENFFSDVLHIQTKWDISHVVFKNVSSHFYQEYSLVKPESEWIESLNSSNVEYVVENKVYHYLVSNNIYHKIISEFKANIKKQIHRSMYPRIDILFVKMLQTFLPHYRQTIAKIVSSNMPVIYTRKNRIIDMLTVVATNPNVIIENWSVKDTVETVDNVQAIHNIVKHAQMHISNDIKDAIIDYYTSHSTSLNLKLYQGTIAPISDDINSEKRQTVFIVQTQDDKFILLDNYKYQDGYPKSILSVETFI